MSNSVNLSLDVTKTGIQNPLIKVRQGDGGFETLHTTVTSNGEPLDLQGWTITFMGTTAGNHKIVDGNVTIVEAPNGIFDYTPSKAWGMDIGEFQMAYFKFVKGDGSASSANFRVNVIEAVDITQEEAQNYISVVDTTIAEIRDHLTNSLADVTASVATTSTAANSMAVYVSSTASSAVNTVNATASSAVDTVNTTTSSAVNTINTTASSAVSQVNSATSSASSVASSAVDNVSAVASNAVANVNSASNVYVKDTRVASGITDFNLVIGKTWSGKWYKAGVHWSNEPTGASNWLQFEYTPGDTNQSGILEIRDWTTNRHWVRTVSAGTWSNWVELANDANVVHNAGTETIAGDKTFTGNTTLTGIKSSNVKTANVALGGMTISFRQTIVGVNVYISGSFQTNYGPSDDYIANSNGVPTSIDSPRQNVVLTIIGNSGISGVTSNAPFKLEVLIGADGTIKYRAKNLLTNDTAYHNVAILGAASTFYSLY